MRPSAPRLSVSFPLSGTWRMGEGAEWEGAENGGEHELRRAGPCTHCREQHAE